MENDIKWIEIESDRVAVKKGFDGWRVVHPVKDENGKVNIVNLLFGGKGNALSLIIILLVLGAGIYGYSETTSSCREFAEHPCDYVCCPNCGDINYSKFDNRTLSMLSLSKTGGLNISSSN